MAVLSLNKRSFLRHLLLVSVGLLSAVGVSFVPRLGNTGALLRPPGALPEEDFVSHCIRCGLCVQACPVHAIHLADSDQGVGLGTPFMVAREQSCGYSCDHLSCVKACPTGALQKKQLRLPKSRARMGMAVLTQPQQCLAGQNRAFQGVTRGSAFGGVLRKRLAGNWQFKALNKEQYDRATCDLCVVECPIPQAISLEESVDETSGQKRKLPRITSQCLGCGVCEMVCPTATASIRIIPRLEPGASS